MDISGHPITHNSLGKGGPGTSQLREVFDSFTVPLHNPNATYLPGLRAVWGDCSSPLENGGNSHMSPECIATEACDNWYLDQPITKGWWQPITGHVSYCTATPIAIIFNRLPKTDTQSHVLSTLASLVVFNNYWFLEFGGLESIEAWKDIFPCGDFITFLMVIMVMP